MKKPTINSNPKYVDAVTLLHLIFDKNSRPSMRWLRTQQKTRAIPYIKIGRLVRFDPDQVRAHLAKKHTVEAR